MNWAAPFSVIVLHGLRHIGGTEAAGLWNHSGLERVRRGCRVWHPETYPREVCRKGYTEPVDP